MNCKSTSLLPSGKRNNQASSNRDVISLLDTNNDLTKDQKQSLLVASQRLVDIRRKNKDLSAQ